MGSVPDVGGGTANIAFLTGKGDPPTGGPNAAAPEVTTTFWIEQVRDEHGAEFAQMQYTQRVLLNFARQELAPHHSRDTQTCAVKGSLRRPYSELSPSDDGRARSRFRACSGEGIAVRVVRAPAPARVALRL